MKSENHFFPISIFVLVVGGIFGWSIAEKEPADPVQQVIIKMHDCAVMNQKINSAITENQQQDFLSEISKDKKPK